VSVGWRRRVGNRKGARHTREQVEETTASHVYCLWLQEVIHLVIWTSFGCVLEKGRGMGTDRGVLGGGRVREVVARGKQSEGDDSFRLCCMKAVRGRVCARTTTLGSTRCTRCVVDTYLDGVSGATVCANALGRGDILGIVIAMTHSSGKTSGGGWLGKSWKSLRSGNWSTRSRLVGAVGLIRWERIERRLGRRIAEQLREMGASVGEVDLGGLEVTVEV
jgi:hypothetical protein